MKPAIPFVIVASAALASILPLILPIARNLEYEYATLCAYAMLLIMPLAAAMGSPKESGKARWVLLAVPLAAGFSYLPGFLLYRFQLCPCSEADFSFWWLIQTLPHLLLAVGASLCLAAWQRQGKRRAPLLYILVLFVLFLHLTWVLWSFPQKRITHLLSGFIHGAIYDNGIFLDPGVLWARGANTLIALGLIGAAGPWNRRLRLSLASIAFSGLLYCSYQASQFPSTTHGLEALDRYMPERMESRLFTLHFAKSEHPSAQDSLQKIFDSAEFHAEDIARQLLAYEAHVHIYVYPSRRDKKLWFGGGGTDITDVRTPSVHINLESWPHSTLRHELVHAMASSFAFHGLGFHPNMAFTEGLAVALAPSDDEVSLHGGAANILRSQRLTDPNALFSPLFWSESGRRAYTVAGSILRFLLDRFGITRVKRLYAGASWTEVFGQDSESILEEWQEFLEKNYPARGKEIVAEALFRYPGLLQDVCPHAKATLADSSDDRFNHWRQPHDWLPARDYWTWRMNLNNDPSTRLQLLRADATKMLLSPMKVEGLELLQRVRESRNDPPRILEDVDVFLLEIDLLIALDEKKEARLGLKAYLEKLHKYRIGDGHTRQLWSRYLLLGEKPDSSDAWLRLLAGTSNLIPSVRSSNRSWIVDYLFLRNHEFRSLDSSILESLETLEVPAKIPKTFAVEWYHFLGKKWFSIGNFAKAEAHLLRAADIAPEGFKETLVLGAQEARYRFRHARNRAAAHLEEAAPTKVE